MKDLWDEEETDACRDRFIASMYKFPEMPSIALGNGRRMPVLGLATWLKQNVQETVEHALRSGFRYLHLETRCVAIASLLQFYMQRLR
jgi:hypothetical protein